MMYWGYGWNVAGIVLGGLLFLVLLAGVAVAAFFIGRASRPQGPGRALDVLRERYARGEITHEEYERLRADLRD